MPNADLINALEGLSSSAQRIRQADVLLHEDLATEEDRRNHVQRAVHREHPAEHRLPSVDRSPAAAVHPGVHDGARRKGRSSPVGAGDELVDEGRVARRRRLLPFEHLARAISGELAGAVGRAGTVSRVRRRTKGQTG